MVEGVLCKLVFVSEVNRFHVTLVLFLHCCLVQVLTLQAYRTLRENTGFSTSVPLELTFLFTFPDPSFPSRNSRP